MDAKADDPFKAISKVGSQGNLETKVFGMLIVDSFRYKKGDMTFWSCICTCGTTLVLNELKLTSGSKTSCGCMDSKPLPSNTASNKAAKAQENREAKALARKGKQNLDLAIALIKQEAYNKELEIRRRLRDGETLDDILASFDSTLDNQTAKTIEARLAHLELASLSIQQSLIALSKHIIK